MKIERIIVGALQTNCYVLQSQKDAIIVDPGGEAEKIASAVQNLNTKLILATHGHSDHVGALNRIKQIVKAEAAIHPQDWLLGFDMKLIDGQIIEFGTETLLVIHTPGHTPGGCCFLIGRYLLSGDTLFPNGPGNTMFPGGDEQAILRSIRDRLMPLPDDTTVYPGHGAQTTIGKERALYK